MEEASSPVTPVWGKFTVSVSGLPLSSKKLIRMGVAVGEEFTKAKFVVQPPEAARCAMDPAFVKPETEAPACSTVKVNPAILIAPERARPVFAPTR